MALYWPSLNLWTAGAAGALLVEIGALVFGIGALLVGMGADDFSRVVAVVDEVADSICADLDGFAGAAALVSVGPPAAGVAAAAGVEVAANAEEVVAAVSGEEGAAPTAGSLLGKTAGARAGSCASAELLRCCDCAMLTPAVEVPMMANPVSIAIAYPRLLVFMSLRQRAQGEMWH